MKTTHIFDEKSILFQWAVLSWSWGGLVAPGAGQERSHAAWRSFFSKTMLPMQRGARSGQRRYTKNQTNNQVGIQHVL